ncbi:hypothetical protein KC364_g13 [Hortaea werneckii]|nr:hypothetical protein KC364_g13 [Hortaea werneckii]
MSSKQSHSQVLGTSPPTRPVQDSMFHSERLRSPKTGIRCTDRLLLLLLLRRSRIVGFRASVAFVSAPGLVRNENICYDQTKGATDVGSHSPDQDKETADSADGQTGQKPTCETSDKAGDERIHALRRRMFIVMLLLPCGRLLIQARSKTSESVAKLPGCKPLSATKSSSTGCFQIHPFKMMRQRDKAAYFHAPSCPTGICKGPKVVTSDSSMEFRASFAFLSLAESRGRCWCFVDDVS